MKSVITAGPGLFLRENGKQVIVILVDEWPNFL